MTDVKRIGLPTIGFPGQPSVAVRNGIGSKSGIIGAFVSGVVQSNRSDALAGLMASHGFDPPAALTERITAAMVTTGFTSVPRQADGSRHSFLETYTKDPEYDGVLDVVVSYFGFSAYSDEADYRLAIALNMRPIRSDDQSVLMSQRFENSGLVDPDEATSHSGPLLAFSTWGQISGNPDHAVAALTAALTYASHVIAKSLA